MRTGVLRTREHFAGEERNTVGACAIDARGNLASATSTGGTPRKIAGRVGDSPLIGSGAYADNEVGAASAIGWGEEIMAVVLSKTALDFLDETMDSSAACREAVELLARRVDGYGGLIMVDTKGRIGYHHNTPKMAFAYAQGDRRAAGIRKEDL